MAPFGFWVFIVGVGLYATAAAYTDFRMQRIPNYLTFTAALGGLLGSLLERFFHCLPGYPTSVEQCILGFSLGFALFFIPFACGGGGSGDVKLAAALGSLLGWFYVLIALTLGLAFAMLAAFILWTTSFSAAAAKTKRPIQSAPDAKKGAPKSKAKRRSAVPFAIPLALGTLCTLCVVFVDQHPEWFNRSNQNSHSNIEPHESN